MKPKHLLTATLIFFTVSSLLFGIEKFAGKDYEGINLSFKNRSSSKMKAETSPEKINSDKLKAGLKNDSLINFLSILITLKKNVHYYPM